MAKIDSRHVDEKQDHNGSGADKHFESYGAYICPDEIEVTAKECNENGSVLHRGLNAEGWAHLLRRKKHISRNAKPGKLQVMMDTLMNSLKTAVIRFTAFY